MIVELSDELMSVSVRRNMQIQQTNIVFSSELEEVEVGVADQEIVPGSLWSVGRAGQPLDNCHVG